jgi:hypothetical protein
LTLFSLWLFCFGFITLCFLSLFSSCLYTIVFSFPFLLLHSFSLPPPTILSL